MTKFLRRLSFRHSKLGKNRKKKQVWRRPTGRDNKMREERNGRPAVVKIGYKNKKSEKREMKLIMNIRDIEGLKKGDIVVLGNVGGKKRIELVKKLHEKGIKIQNANVKRFMKHIEAKKKKKEPKDSKQEGKK